MSIVKLPREILQCILSYLNGLEVIRCRVVSRAWRAAVDGLPDKTWQAICHSQSYSCDYIAARNKYGLSWRDTFKALNSWGHIHEGDMKMQELSINVQRFKVLPYGILACLQNKRNNRNKELANYSDTIVYYNLETMKECSRDEFDFVFSSQLFECNDNFLILILQDGRLCIVLRENKKQFFVGTLVTASAEPQPPPARFIGYTVMEKEIYFKNQTDDMIYVSKLVEVDGEQSVSTKPLEAFKENHDSFEEDIVAFSYKNNNINILTNEGNIYIHNKTKAEFEWVGGFDGRLPFIFNELEEQGFDWKTQRIYNWVATSSHLLIHPSHNAFYAHVRYGTGMIILIASKYFSHINIHNSRYCIDGLWGIVKAAKCKPIRAINVRKKVNKQSQPAVKHISQIDIVETSNSHKILALKQQRLYIFIFNICEHTAKERASNATKKVVKRRAVKLRTAKQKAMKQIYTHSYATRSKSKK